MKAKLLTLICLLGLAMSACDDVTLIKDPVTELSNDCIKRSLATMPNLVGQPIEFVYAVAIPKSLGRVTNVQCVASIAGADATYMDQNSYYTDNSGADVPVKVASVASSNNGGTTTLDIDTDTCAVAIRYYYYPSESARGKQVSFTFSAKASNGQQVSYDMGPYTVSAMDMTKSVVLTSGANCYISFHESDAAVKIVSSAAEADLVYNYSTYSDLSHGFFAGGAPDQYSGATASGVAETKMMEAGNLRDRQLSDLKYDNVIDDADLKAKDFTNGSTNYIINLAAEYGFFYETADKKYRGFVFINKIGTGTVTISAKRLAM